MGNDSPLAGTKPDEVGGLDGGLAKLDQPERHESYASNHVALEVGDLEGAFVLRL